MMKKNGFTLAEVLITLAIIGVVATMTLPALIANTGEQQAKTGLKKAINTLAEAAQMSEAVAGYDFSNLKAEANAINVSAADDDQSIVSLLRTRTVVDYQTTGDGKTDPVVKKANTAATNVHAQCDRFITLRDGVILMYNTADTTNAAYQKIAADGLAGGFIMTVDTNGTKGPNTLANCNAQGATKAGANDAPTFDADKGEYTGGTDPSVCNAKNARAINDRFQVRIRGTRVEPFGAAATWAFQN